MSERVDFSRNAVIYDRRHGSVLSPDLTHLLAGKAGIVNGVRLLDVGAGTGRVAIPFAELGYAVIALEPAMGMIQALRNKAGHLPIRLLAAEGAALPFAEGQFHVLVLARILYLTPDWRQVLREARRVLAPGARLLHEWGNGENDEEWVQIREQARALFEEAGVSTPFHPGVRSESEVDAELAALGFTRESDVPAGPGPTMTLADFLRRLLAGELSYTWNVPTLVQDQCLPRLRAWAEARFDLTRLVATPRQLRWTVFRQAPG